MRWTKEDWIKNTGFSAPFSQRVVDGWAKLSKDNGWDKIADTIRNNILNRKIEK